jgi:NADH-quinone oxidoreductase subunit D
MSSNRLAPGVHVEEFPEEDKVTISVGPQHPGSGHFRLIVTIDGDIVVNAEPDPGYVHRGEEKMCETRDYIQNVPHLERPVILDSSGILFPYVLAAEELLGLSNRVPDKAKYLRILMAEYNRIISHFYFLAIQAIFLGHSTLLMWAMADREVLIDLASMLAGARVTFAYFVPGGVRTDAPQGYADKVLKAVNYLRSRLKDYWRMMIDNPFMRMRMEGIGILKKQDAIRLGAVGPTLRASGVKFDLRKAEPYSLYDTIDFKEGSDAANSLFNFVIHAQNETRRIILRGELQVEWLKSESTQDLRVGKLAVASLRALERTGPEQDDFRQAITVEIFHQSWTNCIVSFVCCSNLQLRDKRSWASAF